jgi:methyltransferase (TIGR00027 family)
VPSRTAQATAAARAAHLTVDREPWIFEDTLAFALLDESAAGLLAEHREPAAPPALASMRVAMTARSRYTEACLAAAVDRGMDQYVVLGAGLDSFAYRSSLVDRLRVYEVDRPATQAWKRERLAAARIPVPARVDLVAVDLATESLEERLVGSGFDPARPAFLSWLGVTQYLTPEAIGATLDVIAGFAAGTELVMEYLVPAELRDRAGQELADYFMPRAAASAEPWLTFLSPGQAADALAARSLVAVDDVDRKNQVPSRIWHRSDQLRPHELGRLVHATAGGSRPAQASAIGRPTTSTSRSSGSSSR